MNFKVNHIYPSQVDISRFYYFCEVFFLSGIMLFPVLLVVVTLFLSVQSFQPELYKCSMCISVVDAQRASTQNTQDSLSLLQGCNTFFPSNYCDAFYGQHDALVHGLLNPQLTSRQICQQIAFCPTSSETWTKVASTLSENEYFDVRVSKALGSRGYDKVSPSYMPLMLA